MGHRKVAIFSEGTNRLIPHNFGDAIGNLGIAPASLSNFDKTFASWVSSKHWVGRGFQLDGGYPSYLVLQIEKGTVHTVRKQSGVAFELFRFWEALRNKENKTLERLKSRNRR